MFQSSHKPQPIIVNALSYAVRRHYKDMGIVEPFVPHDLRRTVRTRLAALGVDEIVSERIMSHTLQGVLKIYNCHHYLDEKRAALFRWANHLRLLVRLDTGYAENVVPINFKRS